MDDIICEQPWSEKGKWFKRNFWHYSDTGRYSVDEYSDGDHEDCDAQDVPDLEEVERDWLEYYRYVAETGEDPLGEFFITRTRKVKKEVWFVSFDKTADGTPYVSRIKHAGRYFSPLAPELLPQHVREYLMLQETPGLSRMETSISWAELEESLGGNLSKLHRVEIEHDVPVSKSVVRRQLLKLARKAVKNKEELLRNMKEQALAHDPVVPQEPDYTGQELTITIRLVEGSKAHVTTASGETDFPSNLEKVASDVAGVVSGWLDYLECEGDTEAAHLEQLERGYARDR
jgi:hypothetical protein